VVFSNIVSDNQHNFCYAKSAIPNLLLYYTDIVSIISKGTQGDEVYPNIRKTFDSIDLYVLLKKI